MNQLEINFVTYREYQEIIDNIVTATLTKSKQASPFTGGVTWTLGEELNSGLKFDAPTINAIYLLAYLDLQPVGTVRITDIDGQTARIDRLAILPEVQNQGIEVKLIDKALELVEINDFEVILIKTKQGCDIVYDLVDDLHYPLQIKCSWETETTTLVNNPTSNEK